MFLTFFQSNDKSLCSHQKIHSKKLLALIKEINNVGHDPQTVIFNFSKYKLTKHQESLLFKGQQFDIRLTEIEYTDFMVTFELSYRDIEFSAENLLAIEMKKTQMLINKPVYLGLSVLDLSKTVIQEFQYDYVKQNMMKIQNFVIWIQKASLLT